MNIPGSGHLPCGTAVSELKRGREGGLAHGHALPAKLGRLGLEIRVGSGVDRWGRQRLGANLWVWSG